MTTTQIKKQKMLKALADTKGLVCQACARAGINRSTHKRWCDKDPKYKEAVEDILEATGDNVEGELLKRIKAGDTAAIIFYCKTKLKHRGFTEKIETEVSGDMEIEVKFGE